MLIGAHVREDDPVATAAARGADVVQMFLADPQGWKKPPAHPQAQVLREGPLTVVVHAPYVVNLASPNNRIRIPSRKLVVQHAAGAAEVGAVGIVVHGGHVTAQDDPADGVENWRKFLARQADEGGFGVPVLIENTAGGDFAMARRFDALARLWDAVAEFDVGFCLDTCHAHSAGEELADAVDRVKAITGRIDLVHLNDSRDAFGSARDRHANIGEGTIDPEVLAGVCWAAGAPVVVETPAEGQAADIAFLRARLRGVIRGGRVRAEQDRREQDRDERLPDGAVTELAADPAPGIAPDAPQPARRAPRPGRVMLAVLVALTGLTLLAGYANKARCVGPEFDAQGRSAPDFTVREYRDVCYSDIQKLWLGRDIDHHVFPYLTGSITPEGELRGGTVEYPVLSGLLMWLAAVPSHDDGEFLFWSALLMAPFGLATGWLLGRLTRWRALVWALGPPLVLYAFHNWDLPVVACAVGAVFAVHSWRTPRSLADRAVVAAVLLGLGSAFKLYPGAFVLPLALLVLTAAGRGAPLDWRGAVRVPLAAGVTVALVNLPFAVAGYDGWRASFTFQELRKVDITTNSIWYWGFRPYSEPTNVAFQAVVDRLSPALVLLSFAAAALAGWRRWRREGIYPWIGVSAAMLCGFLLLHKVHSPQYTLWLLPFFVLLRVRWGWIVAYLVADLVMYLGIFRLFYLLNAGADTGVFAGFTAQAVTIGVWGRAALLAALFVVFLTAPTALVDDRVPVDDRRVPPYAAPAG